MTIFFYKVLDGTTSRRFHRDTQTDTLSHEDKVRNIRMRNWIPLKVEGGDLGGCPVAVRKNPGGLLMTYYNVRRYIMFVKPKSPRQDNWHG